MGFAEQHGRGSWRSAVYQTKKSLLTDTVLQWFEIGGYCKQERRREDALRVCPDIAVSRSPNPTRRCVMVGESYLPLLNLRHSVPHTGLKLYNVNGRL